MNTTDRRSPLSALLPALALVLALPAAAAGPSLDGTWVPDSVASTVTKELKEAAQPGAVPAPPPPPATDQLPAMRIRHKEPRLTVELLAADGAVISTTELTTDGADNLNQRAGGTWLHTSNTSWNGAALRTVWKLERDRQVMISGTDERQLRDPETLVVTTTTEDSRSRSKSVTVYHKQKPAPPAPAKPTPK